MHVAYEKMERFTDTLELCGQVEQRIWSLNVEQIPRDQIQFIQTFSIVDAPSPPRALSASHVRLGALYKQQVSAL